MYLTSKTGLTCDYNDYYVSGAGNYVGFYSSNKATLAAWQTALTSPYDINSKSIDPAFVNAGGNYMFATDHVVGSLLSGTTITGFTTDFYFVNRTLPYIGAMEGSYNLMAPTIETQAATSITGTTVTGNGTITSLGIPVLVTDYGICWSSSNTMPTTADSKISKGATLATGTFTSTITGLTAGATYYARAYATNSTGTSYGSVITFATVNAPTVTTQAVTSITDITATGNGTITSLGIPASVTDYGVCWSSSNATPTTTDSKASNGTTIATGTFTSTITGLTAGATYYVRAYATNSTGTSYGSVVTFTTFTTATIDLWVSGQYKNSYWTLKDAFDAINAGTYTGALVIKVNGNTTEIASAVLNASGTGSASYSSVIIYPTNPGITISGNLAAPLIDLNGADNVTFDGSLNGGGSTPDLTLINTSNAATAGTSTIRFINGATANSVRYCTIKGATMDAKGGVIYFAGGTAGNCNNAIAQNNISNSGGNRPVNVIYSAGSSSYSNSSNAISDNKIYDFFNLTVDSYGINLNNYNTNWVVSDNSFYETTTFSPISGSTAVYRIIGIMAANSWGHYIQSNQIGGSGPNCDGMWNISTSGGGVEFNGFYDVETVVKNTFQSNTIKGFSWVTTGGSYFFFGINTNSVLDEILNNEIGSSTGFSIKMNSDNVGGIWGIYTSNCSTIVGNKIGGLQMIGTAGSNCTGILIGGGNFGYVGNNSISNFSGLNSSMRAVGIFINQGNAMLTRNLITLPFSTTGDAATVYGLYFNGGSCQVYTNIISLGGSECVDQNTFYGIFQLPSKLCFNTVYIGGTASTSNSFALFGSSTGETHNNLFVNARSGGTGVHYAMCVANQLPGAPGPGFSNCNNFYVSGTGGVIGGSYYFGFTSYTTLVDFQTASGQEYNSLNLNPMFVNGSGSYTAAEDFRVGTPSLQTGYVPVSFCETDYFGTPRGATSATIGAIEYALVTPMVTTQAATSITGTTAMGNGTITSLGIPASVTDYGVCWSSSNTTPTTTDSKASNGATLATGTFTSTITGLTAGATYYVRAYATNSTGTSYGSVVTFTTLNAPTVTTQAATSITGTTATGNGTITSLGIPASVTDYGVCWSSSNASPTTTDSKVSKGATSSTGPFIASITGLTAGATYYVRAYATNSAGTSYGSVVTFTTGILPTVTTQAATSITGTTASGNGTITNLGIPASVTDYGVCWSSSNATPTTTDSKVSKGAIGSTGPFIASITGLTAGTTYYARAYATNAVGTSYGSVITFTTLNAPTVTTQAATSIAGTTATGNGTITSLGIPASVTDYGVCWSSSNATPTTTDSKASNGATLATGTFTSTITGLTAGTTYYARAYATNSAGTSYGNVVTFTTLNAPTVTTQAATSIAGTTATGNGTITSLGIPASVTDYGVCWSSSNATPTTTDSKVSKGAIGSTGPFIASITGLTAGATYYARAYATNAVGTSYGSVITFTTLNAPTVSTQAVTSITGTTATGNGTITNLGIPASVTDYGVCWSSSNATPTTADSKAGNGATLATGTFTSTITGLTAGATYYVRAYATNSTGTSYGSVVTFTTLNAPTVTTQAATSITATTATGNGTITSLGIPASVTDYGVCWSSSNATPTTTDSKAGNGATLATGTFTSTITGLTAGTTYYARAYATNSAGTSYGNVVTFTALNAPTVTTQAATSIAGTTATGNGTITSLGIPASVTDYGVCWSSSNATPTTTDSKASNGATLATGTFTSTITGLTAGTTYYARAYATNSAGTSYGNVVTFTALNAPTVTTQAATSITGTTATGNGTITNLGIPASVTDYGVCWSSSNATPTTTDSKASNGATLATGTFTSTITGLTAGATYYARAYATNSAGTSYGNVVTFTALNAPTVTTQAATSITGTTATGNGTITNLGIPASVTDYGVCWSSSNATPTTADSKTGNGATLATGTFTSTITGLTAGTTYYVRAYATNSAGTSYGNVASFTTIANVDVYKGATPVFQAGYTTLKAAFDAINAGTHTGILTLKINNSTTETSSAVLNASGTGSASYTSVTIYPTATGMTISGNLATPLIDLNGADNVTFDGSLNGGGSTPDLTLINTSNAATAGTSTIRFINDAGNNTLKYCKIQGSSTSITTGTILLSTTTGALGNDGNTIDHCNIFDGTTTPYNAIYSAGTTTDAAHYNSGNTISNSNIYNFSNLTGQDAGIYLSAGNTDWTISGNSLYQTATRTSTTGTTDYGICINGGSYLGNNFTLTGNYIGGNAVGCTGTSWTVAGAVVNRFVGIILNVGTATVTSVQGNTISNFDFTSTSTSVTGVGVFCGVGVTAGNVNIGNVTPNTIGSSTVNAIKLTSSGGLLVGINSASTGTVNISNNVLSGMTSIASTAATGSTLYGIQTSGASGNYTISGNTIGSASVANSFRAGISGTTTGATSVIGITNAATGTISILGNTVGNLVSYGVNAASIIRGINSSAGTNTITSNTVRDFSTPCINIGIGTLASVIGISMSSTSFYTTVSQNTVFGLSNTHGSAATCVTGIFYSGSTNSDNVIERNLVYNLGISSTNASAELRGIDIPSGAFTIRNNMIRLGYNAVGAAITNGIKMTGLYAVCTSSSGIYFNSVFVGGTGVNTTAGTTCAFRSDDMIIRENENNIFVNARSNATTGGKHYAVYIASNSGLILNYNDYVASGTGGVFGYYSGDRIDLTAWKAALGTDANSVSYDPHFIAPTAATPDLHISTSTPTIVEGKGIAIACTTDYDGQTRSSLTPTDIGADAGDFIPLITPVTISGSTGANGNYTTLKAAFDAINAHTTQTGNTISITINASTTETASAVLNEGNWTGLKIYPSTTGLSVSGSLAAPLIDLNGADHVTLDGRVNGVGSAADLTISNTNTGTATGTSTIRFIADATLNNITYCKLQGSTTNSGAGIIFFSTGTSSGNDNNTISNNTITANVGGRSYNGICSVGTASNENSSNSVSNNNFFDLLHLAGGSSCINLGPKQYGLEYKQQ